jgi:hypothetical protein
VGLANWFIDPNARVDEFEAGDGSVVVQAQVQQLVDAMAGFDAPSSVSNALPKAIEEQVQNTIAGTWSID